MLCCDIAYLQLYYYIYNYIYIYICKYMWYYIYVTTYTYTYMQISICNYIAIIFTTRCWTFTTQYWYIRHLRLDGHLRLNKRHLRHMCWRCYCSTYACVCVCVWKNNTLYSYTSVSGRDEDEHLSCCDEDVLHSPLRCCAALSTPLLSYAVALSVAL